MKKEFDYHFAEMGDYFTTSWTAKSIEFEKEHSKEINEELRLENLTDGNLNITIKEHGILKHPKNTNFSCVIKTPEWQHL